MLGGQPSMTTPTPPPCDSPKVVIRKTRRNVFPIAGDFKRRSDNCRAFPNATGPTTQRFTEDQDARAKELPKSAASAAAPARTARWKASSAPGLENDPALDPKRRFQPK